MEPIIIALIGAAALGAVIVTASVVRQLVLSRDKNLNDAAIQRSIAQIAGQLEMLRTQIQSSNKASVYPQVMSENKNAIEVTRKQIKELLDKKISLFSEFIQSVQKIIELIEKSGAANEAIFNKLQKVKEGMERQFEAYDTELKKLQACLKKLTGTHYDLVNHIMSQEDRSNAVLGELFKHHSAVLEKIWLRHLESSELIAIKGIEAGNVTFKEMLWAPMQFLMQFFGAQQTAIAPNIALIHQVVDEGLKREEIMRIEDELNSAVLTIEKPEPQVKKDPEFQI